MGYFNWGSVRPWFALAAVLVACVDHAHVIGGGDTGPRPSDGPFAAGATGGGGGASVQAIGGGDSGAEASGGTAGSGPFGLGLPGNGGGTTGVEGSASGRSGDGGVSSGNASGAAAAGGTDVFATGGSGDAATVDPRSFGGHSAHDATAGNGTMESTGGMSDPGAPGDVQAGAPSGLAGGSDGEAGQAGAPAASPSPCEGLCGSWTEVGLRAGDGYRADPVGLNEGCFEVRGYEPLSGSPSVFCWNMYARDFEVNGLETACTPAGASLPPERNGGYCIHVGATSDTCDTCPGFVLPLVSMLP